MRIREGDEPRFLPLPSTYGRLERERYYGKWAILFFYHRDFAAGCEMDINTFINNMDKLKEFGVELIGVSPDPLETHFNFSVQKGIKFELVSDTKGEMAALYGALKAKNPLTFKRKAFLISSNFMVLKEYNGKKTVLYPLEIIYDVEFVKKLLNNFSEKRINMILND
ncbi:MAG: redoxin domain-containing protein [Thaumarchaeota archaeon]|jgi:peroxiredoxin Q/BCP|nr:redoxin domain-containing protein [Nitrososphaerota archaeon]